MKKFACVFPGQGSQYIGMLNDLALSYPLITDLFNTVSMKLGYDLWKLVQEGPSIELNKTIHTQVAVMTADVAIFTVLRKIGISNPTIMAGHSLGEYAALVAANSLNITDAASLVSNRARLMQEAIPLGQGAMAAIVGLTDLTVDLICTEASDDSNQVSIANYNSIGQVVIAGHTEAVDKAVILADLQGARLAKILPVSVPCHCKLLTEASLVFADYLNTINFKTPDIKVISNVDLSIYQDHQQICTLLQKQLYYPVQWVKTIQLIKKMQINSIIECGPGKVLTGLNKRIDKNLFTANIDNINTLQQFYKHYLLREASEELVSN